MPRKLRFYNVKNRERKKRMKRCNTEENVRQANFEDSEQPVAEDAKQLVTEDSEQSVAEDSEQSVAEDSEQSVAEDSEQPVAEDSKQLVTEDSEQSVAEDSEQSVAEDSEQSVTEESEHQNSKHNSSQLYAYSLQLDKGTLCHEEVVHNAGIQSRLLELQSQISIPSNWSRQISNDKSRLLFCRISQQAGPSTAPLKITHCLQINDDLSWSLFVHNHSLDRSKCSALQSFPATIDSEVLSKLFCNIESLFVCVGHADIHFVKMVAAKKGRIISPDGKVAAYIDNHTIELNGEIYTSTVRTSSCELLCSSLKCSQCKAYRANLRAIYNRWSKRSSDGSDTSSHTNDRYLNTPQKKAKMNALRNRMHAAEEEVKRLKDKVCKLSEQSEAVDTELHSDLMEIMNENTVTVKKTYAEGSFARLLWDEQLKATSAKDARQVRWHPVLIKWCLNLKLLSGSAYHALRTSGFLRLPSERTLRDYVHYFSSKPGFQSEVHKQLFNEANLESLPDSRRYVSLVLDEMKIKEGLVYNKYSGSIIGFTDLGDVNNELMRLQQDDEHPPVASHVLVLMVRGIFFKLQFPYAHFGTEGITADILYPIVWEAVRLLEVDGFKVICVTADGDSANRKFFRMHKTSELLVPYKTKNPYAMDGRWLYFIADPPHLIKTVRNCWSHSGESGTRHMQINGQYIEWRQLWQIYHKISVMAIQSKGLTLAPKLKLENLKLTSYSRMRVDLAAQVLSKTVADLFAYAEDPSTIETQRFIRIFDKLFDCLNVRDLHQWVQKRKPDLKPYHKVDDERFEWLETVFLGYLNEWETAARSRSDLNEKEREKLMLSRETREGLRITVKSFVEMGKYLLSSDTAADLFLLSERISQDPLENYFGQLRARGGRNENPNLQQCLHSAAAIRVQKSMATDPVRGNCSRKRQLFDDSHQPEITDTPLPKRKKSKNT